jgi:alpha-glucosidase (family GH31 glycosyl hydrolase)
MREAILFRYTLVPYIYTSCRFTYDEARALVLPMYYDYPTNLESYLHRNQYFFGKQIMISPITTPIDKVTELAKTTIFIPNENFMEFRGEIVNYFFLILF